MIDGCSALADDHQEPHCLPQQKASVGSQSHPPPPISVYLLIEFISQAVREENTQGSSSVLCVSSRRSCAVSGGRSFRRQAAAALRPLSGAGLAALLSVELVITNAVLGNQVTPAEMVRALRLCRDSEKENRRFNLGFSSFPFNNTSGCLEKAQKTFKKRVQQRFKYSKTEYLSSKIEYLSVYL